MMGTNAQAYVIYLRGGPLLLSKVRYSDWQQIQRDYDDYMTSLGPWDLDGILSYFEAEYKEETTWVFSREQIREFMKSNEQILVGEDIHLSDLKSITALAIHFNDHINNRDLSGLSSIITEDHTFIDSSNNISKGKEIMTKGWQEFFESYPDYKNIFEHVYMNDEVVVMLGYSTCSYEPLDGPAIWTAKIHNGLLSEWSVYDDSSENRTVLGIE